MGEDYEDQLAWSDNSEEGPACDEYGEVKPDWEKEGEADPAWDIDIETDPSEPDHGDCDETNEVNFEVALSVKLLKMDDYL